MPSSIDSLSPPTGSFQDSMNNLKYNYYDLNEFKGQPKFLQDLNE